MLRAGQGAHFCVDIHEDVDLPVWASDHRASGGEVVAAVATAGTSLYSAPLSGRVAIAIGNEGAGLSRELVRQMYETVAIPQSAQVESLNVAVAASIVLYERAKQRR